MTTNVVLPVFEADSTLNRGGVELAPVVIDASLDGIQLLDLAAPLINSSTKARSLALPQIEPIPDNIDADLPPITASMWAPYINVTLPVVGANIAPLDVAYIAVTLPKISTVLAGPIEGVIDAYVGGVVLDEENEFQPGTITANLSDGSVTGTLAASLPALTFASASEAFGEIDSRLPRYLVALEGIASTTGEIAASLPPPSFECEGGLYDLAPVLPSITAYLSSSNTTTAQISTQLPWLSGEIEGVVSASASLDASLRTLQSEIGGAVGLLASVDVTLFPPTTSLNALLGSSATLEAALTALEAQFVSAQQVSASISIRLPNFEFSANAQLQLAQVATYVVDTMNNALTTYEAFPFNSFAEINGKYYGAGADGLFELVGVTDDVGDANAPITAVITTGHLHFGSEMQKRMSDFFIAMRATGDITLTVTIDEATSYDYTLSPLDIETLKQRRSLIGKGAKGKYWQFSMTNVDGCDFDFDSFNAAAVLLGRRL